MPAGRKRRNGHGRHFGLSTAEGDALLQAEEANKELTHITDLLCSACEKLESTDKLNLLPPRVVKWWQNHKKIDQERLKQEIREMNLRKTRKRVISKLTPREKEALGIR